MTVLHLSELTKLSNPDNNSLILCLVLHLSELTKLSNEYLNGHIREGNISSGQAEYIYEWSSYILGFRREPITFSAEGKMIKIQMDEKEISLKENKNSLLRNKKLKAPKL